MKQIVEQYLHDKKLMSDDKKIVIGFSGGFDSMALADIVIKLSEEYNFKVILAHLNHNWRGEKSLAEAKHCEDFAKNNNVEFFVETLPENLPHTETVAREERYKFFNRAANKYRADSILTAHTASDNIETILQRIIKGTGIAGLCGIKDTRLLNNITVYRPLLNCSRKDILSYCAENNLTPNNDNSNQDTKYLRNRIRESLLPDLKNNYDNNIENAILRLIQNAIDEEEIIEYFAEKELKKVFNDKVIITKEFLKLPIQLQKRVIKQLLENNDFDYTQKRILEILEFILDTSKLKSGKTYSLTENKWLFVNNKTIEITDSSDYNLLSAQTEINMDGETYLEEFNAVVRVSKWVGDAPLTFPDSDADVIYADFSNLEMPLFFRTRQNGDRIVPFGKHTPVKLKEYLNKKNLSKQDKSKVLLISTNNEVLWIINLGISNSIRVNSMPTHKVEFFYKEK